MDNDILDYANKLIDSMVIEFMSCGDNKKFMREELFGKISDHTRTFLQPDILLAMGARGVILTAVMQLLTVIATHRAFGIGINKPFIKNAEFEALSNSLEASYGISADLIETYYMEYLNNGK